MKKLLLIAVVAGGLIFVGATRSDAQVFFSIGFGPGYCGYYPGYYCPYRSYARPFIIGRTTGMGDIVIIAAIIVILIAGTGLTGIATRGWLEAFEPV